jgi:glucosamine--fructose-6-phosphate aminotransferase (isomerizing)
MCGIVGYIGDREAQGILLKSLSRLEYRGYDSAGIATIRGKKIELAKRKGKLEVLTNDLKAQPVRGTVGVGHCLTPDTLVYLADGRIVPISKIRNGEEAFAFNTKTHKLEPAKVRVTKHLSAKYLCRIKTSFTSIKCTYQHKMYVISNGEIVEKMAGRIEKGDQLIIPRLNSLNAKSLTFRRIYAKKYVEIAAETNRLIKDRIGEGRFTRAEYAYSAGISESYLSHIVYNDRKFLEAKVTKLLGVPGLNVEPDNITPSDTIHGKYVFLPEKSSADLMRIIGYLLGDGFVGKRCVRFKDTDKALLHFYADLVKKTFNINGRVVPINGTRAWLLEVNSLYLCEWLRENIISRKEDFLSSLGQVPDDEAAGFLQGIFDAEGCVHEKARQVSIGLTDKYLVKIAQLLLLRLGMITSFYTYKREIKNWNDAHRITLNNNNSFRMFQSIIGFGSAPKADKLSRLISRKESQDNGQTAFFASPIIPQTIVKVDKVRSDEIFLYDLEVEHPDSSFVADGVVSHNSRWATHGIPSDTNAHPHLDCRGRLAVVHNGIIENYLELKEELRKEGHKFTSETDTETIAHLVEKLYRGDIAEAVRKAVKRLQGSYAIAVIHKDEPDKIVGVRSDSPLIIGVGKGENFFASDVPAVLDHTKNIIYLDNHEIAVLTKNSVTVKDADGRRLNKKISKINWDISQAEKGGYKHFMLKEIFEQSSILGNILDERCKDGRIRFEELKIKDAHLKKIKRIAIVACGTAYHAGLTGKYMLERLAKIPCWVDVSSEFRYRDPLVGGDTLMIVISQSGETADTLAALREAKKHGAKTLAICNVLGSSIARESGGVIYTHAGPEIAVASTKAYTAQLAIFYLLTLYLAKLRGAMAPGAYTAYLKEFRRVPALMEELLAEYKPEYNILAAYAQGFRKYYHEKHNKTFFLYLARNINYPNALEGALKLKEISYISAEGYPAGEMKHGPIALIDENPWVVCIAVRSDTYEKMVSNIQEIKARNGIVIAIATEGDKEILHHNINYLIEVPKIDELFSPLLVAVPLQLLAYYVAREFGYDIDQPRNLAKSVTVE